MEIIWRLILRIYQRIIFHIIRKYLRGSYKILSLLSRLAIIGKKKVPFPRKTVMDRDWDYLIVIDACRYDLFKEVYKKKSDFIISVGSRTIEWAKNTFKKDYYDIIYVTANPVTSKFYLKRILKKIPFFHVEEVCIYGWDRKLGTIPPSEVTKAVSRLIKIFPKKKMIIHFLQPHHPFIGRKKITHNKAKKPVFQKFGLKTDWDVLISGLVSKKKFWDAYKDN